MKRQVFASNISTGHLFIAVALLCFYLTLATKDAFASVESNKNMSLSEPLVENIVPDKNGTTTKNIVKLNADLERIRWQNKCRDYDWSNEKGW